MFYITFLKRTIDILKCAKCKSYDLALSPSEWHCGYDNWASYAYRCVKCGESGTIRLSREVNLEGFDTWEQLQERIDELKVAMSITDII